MWYCSVKLELEKLGCTQCPLDPAIYIKTYNDGEINGVILTHVDDFMHGGNSNFEREVTKKLSQQFTVSNEEADDFCYIGIKIIQNCDGITLRPNDMSLDVVEVDLSKRENIDDLTEAEMSVFRSAVGKLTYISQQNRPDLCFDALSLSTKSKKATVGNRSCARPEKMPFGKQMHPQKPD